MKPDQTSPTDYVVYVRHESTSAAGYQSTSAVPTSLSAIIRNRRVVQSTTAPPPKEGAKL